MNSVLEDIMSYLSDSREDIAHYGMPRRSGRYPWGSGEDPYQRSIDFLGRIDVLKKEGWSETPENILKEFGLSTTQYRAQKALAKDERRLYDVARAKSLKDDGLGPSAIGKIMGKPESSIRSLLDADAERRSLQAKETADFLKKQIDESGMMIDIGTGVERTLGISKEKLKQAVAILESEGYVTYGGGVPQVTNKGQQTNLKVLAPPGTEAKEFYKFTQGELNIKSLNEYISRDGGDSFEKKFTYPESLDSKRLKIVYAEEGGIQKDGVIELRRGVEDLSLGEKNYSQVRILVDGTHFIKGMAVYSDDMPDGVDVVFNTNKHKETPVLGPKENSVLKLIKKDPDNPFGSAIKDAEQGGQYWYTGKDGKKHLGLINKRADEGDWTDWKDALPSQFLAKQSQKLAEKQLNLAIVDKVAEFDEINALNNPTIKKHLLNKFADECDAAAVGLQAAALPGQKYHVILPVNSLKETEVFAPGYEPGTKLALIRYPHGGTFEIPIVTVNNKNADAKSMIGLKAIDAIGINSKVAERLSGADFDGDTVMCIPTNDSRGKIKITSTNKLKDLEGFDSKMYKADRIEVDENGKEHYFRNGREFKKMKNTGTQMGIISNLITDMTLLGADDSEKAQAVKHSMVVIDAEKHGLDYKQSEIDNNIGALHKKYQGKSIGGAATLLSKSKGEKTVDKRQGSPIVNVPGAKYKGKDVYDPSKPEGSLLWNTADDLYYPSRNYDKKTKVVTLTTTNGKKITYSADDAEAKAKYEPIEKIDPKSGKVSFTNKSGDISYKANTRKQKTSKMADTDDAYSLISEARTPMEGAYADFANKMKSLANESRKTMMATGKIEYSAEAKAKYKQEYDSLLSKLNTAELNRPKERYAQLQANIEINKKKAANPDLKPDEIKKLSQQALSKYRQEIGSVARKDRSIKITDSEWSAIQAGAISETILKKILDNADVDSLREKATPRTNTTLSQSKINRIKAMKESNYTLEQIASKMNVSVSLVSKYMKE